MNPQERQLWRMVFAVVYGNGKGPEFAAQAATEAVDDVRARLKENRTSDHHLRDAMNADGGR